MNVDFIPGPVSLAEPHNIKRTTAVSDPVVDTTWGSIANRKFHIPQWQLS